jgi:hypothetical protein
MLVSNFRTPFSVISSSSAEGYWPDILQRVLNSSGLYVYVDDRSKPASWGKENIDLSSVKYGIWYLLASLKKNVTHRTWRALFHFGKYLFQSTRQKWWVWKKMVSHTAHMLNINITVFHLFIVYFISITVYHAYCNSHDITEILLKVALKTLTHIAISNYWPIYS